MIFEQIVYGRAVVLIASIFLDFKIDTTYNLSVSRVMSGFHGAFATGVASQQGTLTLPDTWFRPPFWDLLMLQLLKPNSSNVPCLYSTFHLEYPLVLSRFCFTQSLLISSHPVTFGFLYLLSNIPTSFDEGSRISVEPPLMECSVNLISYKMVYFTVFY